MTDDAYEGWHNHATWLVSRWLTTEPATHQALRDIARGDGANRDKEDDLKAFVEETYDFPAHGLLADLVGDALARVDWREIVLASQEESRREQGTPATRE